MTEMGKIARGQRKGKILGAFGFTPSYPNQLDPSPSGLGATQITAKEVMGVCVCLCARCARKPPH